MTIKPEHYMLRALELSQLGLGSVAPNPSVGCIIVHKNEIIGEGYTSPYGGNHAEVNAINSVDDHSLLPNSTLYVTLEPCAMCAGAIVHSRVKRVVYGASDLKTGAGGSVFNIMVHEQLNHQVELESGLLASKCAAKISHFFARRRQEKKQLKQSLKNPKL